MKAVIINEAGNVENLQFTEIEKPTIGDDEVLIKVEYSLTETGLELIPFIDYLKQWGEAQIEKENKIKSLI